MKKSIRAITASVLLASTLVATAAWSQDPAPSSTTAAVNHEQKHAAELEKRISDLHAQLMITDQQSTQWSAFAQTMRDNSAKTSQAFEERKQKLPTLNADEAMKSYADLAQLQAQNLQKLAAAMTSLYAVLSPEQKQTADVLFRNPHAKHPGPHHSHKTSAAPASASSTAGATGS